MSLCEAVTFLESPSVASSYSTAVPLPDGGFLLVTQEGELMQLDEDGVTRIQNSIVSDPVVSLALSVNGAKCFPRDSMIDATRCIFLEEGSTVGPL